MANPLPGMDVGDAVDSVAHVIQVALTPVFLLSGIGTLLNVFNTRLSRLSDHTLHISEMLSNEQDAAKQALLITHLIRLKRRRLVLDSSVALGALGGSATCGAAFVLFLGSMRDTAIALWLFWLFGVALGCTVCALMAFLLDSILAWHGMHREGPLPSSKRGNTP
jgi:hypothetical protein